MPAVGAASGKKRLLWVGDAGCPSGFALSTHKILETVHRRFDVTVLGLNYNGDKHTWPYDMYSCFPGGDMFGLGRLIWMCDLVQPDIIVIQNDPWNIPLYMKVLKKVETYANVPVVGIVAVDGENCLGDGLNGLALAIFWTQFGLIEARKGGYHGPATVIPLGVDLDVYYPMDKYEARLHRGLPKVLDDAFIVGNVNRNQPRKQLGLTIRYFAKWVHTGRMKDAYLYLHVAPTGDKGIGCQQLASHYGISTRLLLMEPPIWYGLPDSEMRDTYNAFDVQVSTTLGEGFGLTTFEGMACGVPQIVPAWSALGELLPGAAKLIPCSAVSVSNINVVGGIPDEAIFVKELDELWKNKTAYEELRQAGLARVREDRFRWENVARAVDLAIDGVEPLAPEPEVEREEVTA